MMKTRRTKTEAKPITITVERLSDNSRMTFTISSDKTIKQLRTLLNHHLPPLSSGRFDLYSYQRGALIHFHPSSFKLDYFPVIFDQSVLVLKMDDRLNMNVDTDRPKSNRSKQHKSSLKSNKCLPLTDILSSKTASTTKVSSDHQAQSPSSASSNVTCLTLLKQFFHRSSTKNVNQADDTNPLTY
ncbi:unnamed protein product [Adineta ricciae]|uniref:Ubiquitin-like domain-containing protein n=1 Tax=Adineta ricciae TaxID=249248 RepID=A0A813YMA3_ADIRI|nr:unnamed protein product [Adineta ricciae]CAF0925520.1 unnamed protein product [Adineta ricciae]